MRKHDAGRAQIITRIAVALDQGVKSGRLSSSDLDLLTCLVAGMAARSGDVSKPALVVDATVKQML